MPKLRKTLKGQVNKLIDDLMHPYFKHHPTLILKQSFFFHTGNDAKKWVDLRMSYIA